MNKGKTEGRHAKKKKKTYKSDSAKLFFSDYIKFDYFNVCRC